MADRSSLYQSLCTFDALSVFVLSLLLIATAFTPFSVLYYIFQKRQRRQPFKLDLSAIVYPTLQRRDFSSVYRLSVLLKEEIDPEILQRR